MPAVLLECGGLAWAIGVPVYRRAQALRAVCRWCSVSSADNRRGQAMTDVHYTATTMAPTESAEQYATRVGANRPMVYVDQTGWIVRAADYQSLRPATDDEMTAHAIGAVFALELEQ